MSYLFMQYAPPPLHMRYADLLNNHTPADVKEQFQALTETLHNVVPNDILAIILREAISQYSDSERKSWGNDFIKWFQHWNYTPALRESNPLIVYETDRLLSDQSVQVGAMSLINKEVGRWAHVLHNVRQTSIRAQYHIFCGLVIDPDHVKHIKSIQYIIGGQIFPMRFDLLNPHLQKIKLQDGTSKTVHMYQADYLPFVPLCLLIYHETVIRIKFKTNEVATDDICSQIYGIWTNVPNNDIVLHLQKNKHEMYPPVPLVESRWVPGVMIPDPDKLQYKYVLRIMSGMCGLAYISDKSTPVILSEERKKWFHHPEQHPFSEHSQ